MIDLLDPELWDRVDTDAQKEILRQSELMVAASVALAQASDNRTATTMNIFGAGAIALLAAAATLLAGGTSNSVLIVSAFIAAIGLFAASICCAFAVAPITFLLPGARPSSILGVGIHDNHTLLASLINSSERSIKHNKRMIDRSARWFRSALFLASGSIISGIGIIFLWYYFPHVYPW